MLVSASADQVTYALNAILMAQTSILSTWIQR